MKKKYTVYACLDIHSPNIKPTRWFPTRLEAENNCYDFEVVVRFNAIPYYLRSK